jgi:hypothetical protein
VIGRICGVVALAALAVALMMMGCGDDSETSSNVTKAQFIKEAEAICAERKKEWDAETAVFVKETEANKEGESFAEVQKRAEEFFVAQILPLLRTEQENLEGLDPPEADEAQIEQMLQSRAQGLETLEDKGVESVLDKTIFGPFEREAKAYGIQCELI